MEEQDGFAIQVMLRAMGVAGCTDFLCPGGVADLGAALEAADRNGYGGLKPGAPVTGIIVLDAAVGHSMHWLYVPLGTSGQPLCLSDSMEVRVVVPPVIPSFCVVR